MFWQHFIPSLANLNAIGHTFIVVNGKIWPCDDIRAEIDLK